jgi:hypothetical protein
MRVGRGDMGRGGRYKMGKGVRVKQDDFSQRIIPVFVWRIKDSGEKRGIYET